MRDAARKERKILPAYCRVSGQKIHKVKYPSHVAFDDADHRPPLWVTTPSDVLHPRYRSGATLLWGKVRRENGERDGYSFTPNISNSFFNDVKSGKKRNNPLKSIS